MYPNIYEIKRRGALVFATGEAEAELASESLEENEEVSSEEIPEETPTDDTNEESNVEQTPSETPVDSSEAEKKSEPVTKIQTLDVVTACMNKFDLYMADTKIDWNMYINNGRISGTPNFALLDDLYNLLNNTLDEKKFEFVAIFNKLFENLTDTNFCKNLSLYGREKYGKPFLAEGLALLIYELATDWAVFLVRYFKELPKIQSSEDSFVRKFPNLRLLSYIAKLFNDSSEFGKLISSDKAKELLTSDTKYSITSDQAKKKPRLFRARAESVSYFASLIRFDFADIMVGAIDKLGTVAFLSSKCTLDLHTRVSLIAELIRTVVSRDTSNITSDINGNSINTKFVPLENKVLEILKGRSEARIMLDSNEKNFPMKI